MQTMYSTLDLALRPQKTSELGSAPDLRLYRMFPVHRFGQKGSYLSQSPSKLPHVHSQSLRKHQYYIDPIAISKFYCKYSHEKAYLSYEDILEALLPHQDYVLVSSTLSSRQERVTGPSKFSFACHEERGKTI